MWQKNWFKIWNKNTDFEIKNLISNWVLFKNKLVNLMTVSQNFSECSTEHIKSFKEGLRKFSKVKILLAQFCWNVRIVFEGDVFGLWLRAIAVSSVFLG